MKILIGYDGSKSAEVVLNDLQCAGLPTEAEALILSVSEVWLPHTKFETKNKTEKILQENHRELAKKVIFEAESFSRYAKEKLKSKFPGWNIFTEAIYGSPASEILAKAEEIKADLVVVGSHGQNVVSRFFMGSISNKVMNEAKCSVRIAREQIENEPEPMRIIIGYDDSLGAKAAVEAVTSRNWGKSTEVRLVMATNSLIPSGIGRFIHPKGILLEKELLSERCWIKKLAEKDIHNLENAGIAVELCIKPGNPKQILIDEANKWKADSIFVGANSSGRLLLGSTSAAVAMRAGCSVEVVRKIESF